MNHHQWQQESRNIRESIILLLVFVTFKAINHKALGTKVFEGGYYDMTQGGSYMGLNVYNYNMTAEGGYIWG